jgi:hypothetical protein
MKYLIIVFILIPFNIFAQESRSSATGWSFHSINELGILKGTEKFAFEFQTINGVQYRSWFGGAGMGIDDYRFRSTMAYLDLRKNFGKSTNHIFLYGDAGINISWPSKRQKNDFPGVTLQKFHNGVYAATGVGYAIKTGKNQLLFSAGYSFKRTKADVLDIRPIAYDGPPLHDVYDFKFHRIDFRVGWSF